MTSIGQFFQGTTQRVSGAWQNLPDGTTVTKGQAVTAVCIGASIFILCPDRFRLLRDLLVVVPFLGWLTALAIDFRDNFAHARDSLLDHWKNRPWLLKKLAPDIVIDGTSSTRKSTAELMKLNLERIIRSRVEQLLELKIRFLRGIVALRERLRGLLMRLLREGHDYLDPLSGSYHYS